MDEYNGPKKKEDLIKFLMKNGLIKPKYTGGKRIKKKSSGKTRANKCKKSKLSKMSKRGRKTHKRKTKRKIRRITNRK